MGNQITAPVTLLQNVITAPVTTAPNVIDAPVNTSGRDAYQLAVAGGFVGTRAEWLATLVGPQGPQGAQGAKGLTGNTGGSGPTGPAGLPPGLQFTRAANAAVPSAGQLAVDQLPGALILRVAKTAADATDNAAFLGAIIAGAFITILPRVYYSESPFIAFVSGVTSHVGYYEYALSDATGTLPSTGEQCGFFFSRKGDTGQDAEILLMTEDDYYDLTSEEQLDNSKIYLLYETL